MQISNRNATDALISTSMDSRRMLSGNSVASMMNPRRAEEERRRKALCSLCTKDSPDMIAGLSPGGAKRDYVRANAKAAQEIARRRDEALRRREAAHERHESAGRWKMDRFRDVYPRLGKKGLREGAPASPGAARPDSSPKPFLHRKSRSGAEIESSPPPSKYERPASSPRKPGVPRAGEVLPAPRRAQRDLIRENAIGTIRGDSSALAPSARSRGGAARRGGAGARREGFGSVPTYLKARKERWAREEAEAEMAVGDPGCPEGMRRVPEEERAETVALLKERLREAQGELARAPRGADSISARRFRSGLEARLTELEEAIAVFSKKDVLVEDSGEGTAGPSGGGEGGGRRPLGPRKGPGAGASKVGAAARSKATGPARGGGGQAVKPRVPSHRVAAGGRGRTSGGRGGRLGGKRATGGRSGPAEDEEEDLDLGPVISNVPADMF